MNSTKIKQKEEKIIHNDFKTDNIPILNIPIASNKKNNEIAIKQSEKYRISCELDCTLSEAEDIINQNEEYKELVAELIPSFFQYLKTEYYKNGDTDDNFLHKLSKELAQNTALELLAE